MVAWFRFALQVPGDRWEQVWEQARQGRQSMFIALLKEILGFQLIAPGPLPTPLPLLAPGATLSRVDLTDLRRRAIRSYPCMIGLIQALDALPSMMVSCKTAIAPHVGIFSLRAWQIPTWDQEAYTRVWIEDNTLLAVEDGHTLHSRGTKQEKASRFQHKSIRWPITTMPVPEFRVTAIAERMRTWKALLGLILCATSLSILKEGFVIQRKSMASPPFRLPNLKTVYLNTPLIDKMVVKYAICGILSAILPHHPVPRCILPIGLVPKKDVNEPHRVITDARPENQYQLDWPTRLA
eukprot:379425-Rhodomonas_salina.1